MVQKLVFGAFNFTAPNTTSGIEPWVTDGTAAGTMQLKDINVGSSGSSPQFFYSVNGKVVFYATTPANGSELWVTDGTTEGTTLLADINPGTGSAGVNNLNFTTLGNKMLFTANSPATGIELWVTDGTPGGTQLLRDIVPGPGNGNGQSKPLAIIGNTAIFAADGDVWSTDGTPAGTVKVYDFAVIPGLPSGVFSDSLYQANGLVYFTAYTASPAGRLQVGLWVTDGTTGGTKPISDLGPDSNTSVASALGTLGNTTFFVAEVTTVLGPTLGAELYVSTGTSLELFREFVPGFGTGHINPDPTRVAVAGNQLFFTREIPAVDTPTELWVIDGATGGTQLLQSFVNITGPRITVFGDSIVFTATTTVGGVTSSFAPWISDGTVAGTRQLLASNPTASGNSPDAGNYTEFDGKLFFTAIGGSSTGKELWVTDGTAAGTMLFKDINPGAAPSSPSNLIVVGDKLFFQATTASGREYWVSDGTPQGTVQVKDIAEGSLGSVNPASFASAILGDAAPLTPTYAISGAPTASEGGTLTFTVTRDIGTAAGTVALALGGTATSGSDYTTPGLSVSFAAGETTKTVTITTLADATAEPDETVTLTLGAVTGGGTVSTTGGTATGTITNVVPVTAGDDSFTTISGVALTFTAAELLSNDTGSTGLAGIALTSTAGGTITFEDGAYVYRAPVGFTGVDTFTYNAQGAGGVQDEATVSVTVTPDPVDAVDDSFTTISGVALTFTAAELLSNDTGSTGLAGIALTSTAGGTITFEDGAYVYRAPVGFTGVDTFTYNAQGAGGVQDEATVSVTVTPDPVDAVDDSFTTISGVPLTFTAAELLANDTGAVGIEGLDIFSPNGGSVSFADGVYTYRSATGFTGIDALSYRALGVGGTPDLAFITVTVTPDPVDAVDDSFTTISGVPLTFTAAELLANDTGAVGIEGLDIFSPNGGSVSFADGVYTYRSATGFTGIDALSYRALGVGGTPDLAFITVTVTPDPVDAVDDSFTTISGVPLTFTAAELLANDIGAVGIEGLDIFSPNGGSVSFADGVYTYRSATGFTGIDALSYRALGVGGTPDLAFITVTVTPDPVDAVDDSFTTISGVPLTFTAAELLANDTGAVGIEGLDIFSPNGGSVSFADGVYTYRSATGFTGIDALSYRALGVGGTPDLAFITVTVTPDPVDAVDDSFTTISGVPLTFTAAELLANDTGAVGIEGLDIFSPNGGSVSFADGVYTYRSATGFTGIDALSYRALGVGGTPDLAFITVTVTPDPVDAVDDSFTTISGVPLTFTAAELLANDTGAVGIEGLDIFSPNGGSVSFADGVYTYRSATGFTGIDALSYRALGVGGTPDLAFITVTVTPDPVDAVDDSFTTISGVPLTFTAAELLANDTGAVGIEGLDIFSPNGGSVSFADGVYTYRSATGFTGIDALSYRALGVGGTPDLAFITVTVTPDPVDAVDDSFTTISGVPLTFTAAELLANDIGAVGIEGLDIFSPNGGSVSFADGVYTYRSATGFTGIDALSYRALGVGGTPDLAFITVTVTPDPVDAVDDSFTTISGVPLTFTAAELLANDTGAVGIEGLDIFSPNGGSVSFADGVYTYRSATGFTGIDALSYRALGVGGTPDLAFITVTVTPDPVDAVDDSFTTISGVPLNITAAELLANDTGAVGITGSTLFTATGALVGFQNGAFVYVNSGGFTGVDSFTYNAVGVGGTQDQATVFITVTPDPVNPGEDAFTTIQGVPLTITQADLTANDVGVVSIASVTVFSAQGALVSPENGAYVYRPLPGFTGSDFFTYNAVGIGGTQVTTTVRVLVTPDPVNPGEDAFTTIQGVPLTITQADLTANDVGVVSIASVTVFSAQGALVTFENGAYVYRPLPGFTGSDFFTYKAQGIGGKQVEATVRILVTPDPNGNPVDANDDTFTTIAGVPLSITAAELTANDTGVLSIASATLFSANGALVSFENGAYVYRPLPGFTGTDFFTYTAVGSGGAQQTAAVFVNVTPDPVAPVNDVFTTIAGVPLSITPAELTANDTGVVKIASATLFSANGALVSFENGAYVYHPLPGFTGADFFTYKAEGIGGTLVEATVTVNVTPDPVDPADDAFTTIAGVPLTITPAELTANDVGVVKIASATLFSANGALVSFENGAYVYHPLPGFTGADFFTYKAEGIGGTLVEATVTVNVTPSTNAPPVGVADSYTTTYQKALTVLVAQGVLENDTDPNGDALSVVGVQTDVAHGTLALNANGSFTYTPDLGFAGADSFVYTLRDSAGLESTATAQITVEAPEFNVVSGTRLAQTLRGTDGSDVLLMGNTRIATMQGGQGADVFVFTETDGNRRLETAYIRDYEVGVDAIDLAGATIARTIEFRDSVILIFDGGDRDTLVIRGVDGADQLTFTDAWSRGHLLS